MRLSFIIFSFVISISFASAKSWQPVAEQLISDEGKEDEARKKLKEIKNLDDELKKALEKTGREEQLALNTIRKMPRVSLVDHLLKKTEKMDVHDQRTASYLVTLISMVETEKGNEILDKVLKQVSLTSAKISSSLRIALLSGMQVRERLPSIETMKELLEDTSYEMRLKAVDVAGAAIEKNPEAFESFLKKALAVSPYPVRLKALEQVKLLPENFRAQYKTEIQKCSKDDPNETVKETCKGFRF